MTALVTAVETQRALPITKKKMSQYRVWVRSLIPTCKATGERIKIFETKDDTLLLLSV